MTVGRYISSRCTAATLFAASALAGAPADAQTTAEAAALNIQLAITLCVQNGHDEGALLGAFQTAGYTHLGTGETFDATRNVAINRNTFGTPDQTVSTDVTAQGLSLYCSITTDVFSVSQMIPFARAVFDQLYSGPIADESPEAVVIAPGSPAAASAPCTGFHALPGRSVIWFQFGVAGNDPVCVDNGTAQIMISL